jgi:hypothetical protein
MRRSILALLHLWAMASVQGEGRFLLPLAPTSLGGTGARISSSPSSGVPQRFIYLHDLVLWALVVHAVFPVCCFFTNSIWPHYDASFYPEM